MNMKYLLLTLSIMALSGCGIAIFDEETYTAENYLIHSNGSDKVWLYVVPTITTKHIFPFYYSKKILPPYSIGVTAHSKIEQDNSISISQLSIRQSEDKLVEQALTINKVVFSTPHDGAKYFEGSILIPLDSPLPFHQDKEIEVCVSFSLGNEKIDACNIYQGTKHEDTRSNFNLYMGV